MIWKKCHGIIASMLLIFIFLSRSEALARSMTSATRGTGFVLQDFAIIRRGGVCVLRDWISHTEANILRKEIGMIRDSGSFKPSGLSNRRAGDQNQFGEKDRLTFTLIEDSPIETKLRKLCQELQDTLNCNLELAEQYYSISPPGSFLPRHMDERHEETKGERGWFCTSRRSISWILYLTYGDWKASDGGELRLYCRETNHGRCGANEGGDLQVGWLPTIDSESTNRDKESFDAVFLDSWQKAAIDGEWRARSALYRLVDGERDYLSDPFGPDSPNWPSEPDLKPGEFAIALSRQLKSPHDQTSFVGLEQIGDPNCITVDVAPRSGTLVLFDSATLPHEVLETQKGERMALAGWLHEAIQPFPAWYGTLVD